mmetsp:Transcript_17965/g.37620  ORF Transcript_17965/g.37620 Transcript_17965/m.37620 type:complete len:87 (-) Transcript_17965:711-971(-)
MVGVVDAVDTELPTIPVSTLPETDDRCSSIPSTEAVFTTVDTVVEEVTADLKDVEVVDTTNYVYVYVQRKSNKQPSEVSKKASIGE